MRGLKDGQPFWLMEQTPSYTATRDVNPSSGPGVMRLWSWQAVAHGADAVLFFQMRASRGACEKYHGAVIGHAGRTDTRVFREVAALGAELDAARRRGCSARGRRPGSRCCSTGTAGGRWRSPTARRGWSATSEVVCAYHRGAVGRRRRRRRGRR